MLELYLFRNHALLTVFFDLGKNTLTLGWKFRAKLTHSFLDFNMVFIIFTLKRLTLSIWAENKKSFIVLSLTSTKRKTSSMHLQSKSKIQKSRFDLLQSWSDYLNLHLNWLDNWLNITRRNIIVGWCLLSGLNKQTNKPCTLVSFAVSRLFSFAVINVDEMVFWSFPVTKNYLLLIVMF